jgi:starch-binding outer membrane protein, SusD/RagB family
MDVWCKCNILIGSTVNEIQMNTIKKGLPILFAIFMFSSCFKESNLDLQPFDDTEADIFDESADFERAMIGTYSKLMDLHVYNSGNFLHPFWLLPGDDVTPSAGSPSFEIFSTLQPGDGSLNRYFDLTYQLVNRTNTILQKIDIDENAEESAFNDTAQRDHLKGESYFLRGVANFNLWNYFGTAPVVNERISSQDQIQQPGSDGIQLLDQAIADFTEAATLLPDSWSAADRGRATKNSAYGFMGKAQVFKACWTGDASLYSQAITNFDKITGRSLVSNYGDNFASNAENNNESVFEVQAGQASGSDNVWLANDDFSVVGSWSAYYGYFDNHWSNFSGITFQATTKLIDAIDTDDPRLPFIVDPSNSRIKKYMLNSIYADTGVGTINNPRILRYADILLLKAEALNETGNTDGAIALINQVRTRARDMGSTGIPANYASGASQAQVRTWIMDERFVELAAEEGQRWLDLRRWHKAGKIDLSTWDFDPAVGSVSIELPKHLLWPIPTSEIDLNSNVNQNEGY